MKMIFVCMNYVRRTRTGMWWWWVTAAVAALAVQVASLHGPNVCMVQQKYNVTKRVKYRAPMSVRSYEWCFAVPPRCTKWTTEIRDLTRLENEERTAEVAVCCPGYKMKDISCVPVCPSGKTGHKCALDCPLNKWGPNCTNTCQDCVHGKCSPKNGRCLCQEGWQGESCVIKSSPPIPSSTTEREIILTTTTLSVPKLATTTEERSEILVTTQSSSTAEAVITTPDPVTQPNHPETISTTTMQAISSTTTKPTPIPFKKSSMLASLDEGSTVKETTKIETKKSSTERLNIDSSPHFMEITTEKTKTIPDFHTTTIENNISVVTTEQSGFIDNKTNPMVHPTMSITTQTQIIYTNATLHPWHKTTQLLEERVKQSFLEPTYNIMKTEDLRNTITKSDHSEATNPTLPVQQYKSTSYGTSAPNSTPMPTLKNTNAVLKTSKITTTKKTEDLRNTSTKSDHSEATNPTLPVQQYKSTSYGTSAPNSTPMPTLKNTNAVLKTSKITTTKKTEDLRNTSTKSDHSEATNPTLPVQQYKSTSYGTSAPNSTPMPTLKNTNAVLKTSKITTTKKTEDLRNTSTKSDHSEATNPTLPVQQYKSTSYGTSAPNSTPMPTLKNTNAVLKTSKITTTKKPEVISKILPTTNKFKPKEIWIRPTQKGELTIVDTKLKPPHDPAVFRFIKNASKVETPVISTTPRTIIVSIIPTSLSYPSFKKITLTTSSSVSTQEYGEKKQHAIALDSQSVTISMLNHSTSTPPPSAKVKTFIKEKFDPSATTKSLKYHSTKITTPYVNKKYVFSISNTTNSTGMTNAVKTSTYSSYLSTTTPATSTKASKRNLTSLEKFAKTIVKTLLSEEDELSSQRPSTTYTKYQSILSTKSIAAKFNKTKEIVKAVTQKSVLVKNTSVTSEGIYSDIKNSTKLTSVVTIKNDVEVTRSTNIVTSTAEAPAEDETFHILTEPEHITAMIDDKGTKTSSLDLISLLSIAGGVMMSIITVAVIIVMIERCRRPKYEDNIRRTNQLHMKTMMDTNAPPPSYSRRGFHAPLPDPPTFDKSCHYQPLSTLDRNLKQFMRPVTVQAISPIMIENFRGIFECHYDHLPKRRQFEENINSAPSMSKPHEPLYTPLNQINSTIQHEARLEVLDPSLNEPLYAEIPCWRPPSEHAIEILTINSEAVTEL